MEGQVFRVDEITLKTFQNKQLINKLTSLMSHYTIPKTIEELNEQYSMLERILNELKKHGGDNRRHNRGSREERLPDGCILRQRLCLPNKQGFHDKILKKTNGTYICLETNAIYTTLHQANEAHYVECGRVWTKEDEMKNPRHKNGKAKNAVSAWGNGTNGQAFYALRSETTDQYDVPIIDINDDEWYNEHKVDFAISAI